MPRLRLMLMGLGLIALVWVARWAPQSAYAQVGQNSNGVGASVGLNLAARELVRAITEAEKLLATDDKLAAIVRIQSIMDLLQDGFYRPPEEEAGRFISLKQQAETLLSKADPGTLQLYEQRYGAEARKLFDQAVATRDLKSVQEVMRRFMHTAAGADAAYWLGSYHLDRADYASAWARTCAIAEASSAQRSG